MLKHYKRRATPPGASEGRPKGRFSRVLGASTALDDARASPARRPLPRTREKRSHEARNCESWYWIAASPRSSHRRRSVAGSPGVSQPSRHAGYALGGGVFEVQRLVGMEQVVDGMSRRRRLGETGEDQFQLSRIGHDVADGEDARPAGGARARDRRRYGGDPRSSPNRERDPRFCERPKKGSSTSASQTSVMAVEVARPPPFSALRRRPSRPCKLIGDDQIDRAAIGQFLQFRALSGAARNLGAAVDDGDARRQLRQRHRPVHRRIAAAGDDHAPAAVVLAAGNEVVHATARRMPLVLLDAGERRPVGTERADAGRDDHRRAASIRAPVEVSSIQRLPSGGLRAAQPAARNDKPA